MNINPLYLKQSAKIASLIGSGSDWVQGGGGNFSIKIDKRWMLIKASGLPLKDVDAKRGIVLVDYLKAQKYFDSLSGKKINVELENSSNQIILDITKNFLLGTKLKASIEVGFHTFLKKYTVHSHSVYANLINCSVKPEVILSKIFKDCDISYAVAAYSAPGLSLTRQIEKSVHCRLEQNKTWPEVIFLQNHGIIINSDDYESCLKLYLQVDKLIKKYFKIRSIYPKVAIKKFADKFESCTPFLKKYLNSNTLNKNLFKPVLFPDQVVYLNSRVVTGKNLLKFGEKFYINKKTNQLIYNTNEKESMTIEETIVAYCYIKENIKKFNFKLKNISQADIRFINKMESEKYRQKLLKK